MIFRAFYINNNLFNIFLYVIILIIVNCLIQKLIDLKLIKNKNKYNYKILI